MRLWQHLHHTERSAASAVLQVAVVACLYLHRAGAKRLNAPARLRNWGKSSSQHPQLHNMVFFSGLQATQKLVTDHHDIFDWIFECLTAMM